MTPAARASAVALGLAALAVVAWWLWPATESGEDDGAATTTSAVGRGSASSRAGSDPSTSTTRATDEDDPPRTTTGEPSPAAPAVIPPPSSEAPGDEAPAAPPSDLGVPAGPALPIVPPEPGALPPPRGSLSAEEVRGVIREALPELRFCFEWQLSRHPELAGRLTMDFTIAEDGSVREAHVAEDLLADETVARCFTHVTSNLHFPVPDPPGEVNVRYPFVLSGSPPARAPEGI